MDLIFAGIIGLLAAWLVNYLSDTLPTGQRPGQPACQHCQVKLSWKNYLTFSRCPECGKQRHWRTWLVLVLGIALSLWLWLSPPVKMGYWLGLLVLAYFSIIVIIDAEHRYIMMSVVLAGIVLGLGTGILMRGWVSSLIGGLAGVGIMGVFYLIGILFARYRAKKLGTDDGEEALGLGDVYLALVLGLMLGWPRILVGLMFGILAGGIVSLLLIVVLVLSKRYQSMTVFTAYGPYLVLGAFLLLYLPQIFTLLSER